MATFQINRRVRQWEAEPVQAETAAEAVQNLLGRGYRLEKIRPGKWNVTPSHLPNTQVALVTQVEED